MPSHDMTVVDPHEPDEHPPVIEGGKELLHQGHQNVVRRRIGNPFLLGIGLKITVPDLHTHTARHLIGPTELVGQVLRHGEQGGLQFDHIGGILSIGTFRRNGLPLNKIQKGILPINIPSTRWYTSSLPSVSIIILRLPKGYAHAATSTGTVPNTI